MHLRLFKGIGSFGSFLNTLRSEYELYGLEASILEFKLGQVLKFRVWGLSKASCVESPNPEPYSRDHRTSPVGYK